MKNMGCAMKDRMLRKPAAWCVFLIAALFFLTAGPCRADEILDLIEEAFEAHTNNEFDKAIEIYTRIIDSGKLTRQNLAVTYNLRGEAYSDKGDCASAIEDFTRAIEIKPEYAQAYYFRSFCYQKAKDYENAWADLEKAIFLRPEKVLYRESQALLAALMGKTEKPAAPSVTSTTEPAGSEKPAAAPENASALSRFLKSPVGFLKSLIGLGGKAEKPSEAAPQK